MSPRSIQYLVGYFWLLAVWAHGHAIFEQLKVAENHHIQKRASEKCMGELGCFAIPKEFFHPVIRPLNILPADRESINTKFVLYTKKTRKDPEFIKATKEDIDKSMLNTKRETVILIHGMTDKKAMPLVGTWMQNMGDEFMDRGDYNIIVVDWTGGSFIPYIQAVANARVVGAEIAFLVNFLVENYSLDSRKVHLIGHSLGGQVVGYAGERIPNLGRITALDPAMPQFQGMPPSVRIDPTDALFVDVIHTDSKTLILFGPGMSQPCGHVDFYPDGGNNHPGCVDKGIQIPNESWTDRLVRVHACNHDIAIHFMLDSIKESQCSPMSIECADWESFKGGLCTSCGLNGERCAKMGLQAIEYKPFVKGNDSLKFYTITGSKAPFCTYLYQVQIKLQNNKGQSRHGSLKMTILGSKNIETFNLAEGNVDLHPGETYKFLIGTSHTLDDIKGISFKWDRSSWIIGSIFKHYIFVETIKITPINEPDAKIREEMSTHFCVKDNGDLESGKTFEAFPTTEPCK